MEEKEGLKKSLPLVVRWFFVRSFVVVGKKIEFFEFFEFCTLLTWTLTLSTGHEKKTNFAKKSFHPWY